MPTCPSCSSEMIPTSGQATLLNDSICSSCGWAQ